MIILNELLKGKLNEVIKNIKELDTENLWDKTKVIKGLERKSELKRVGNKIGKWKGMKREKQEILYNMIREGKKSEVRLLDAAMVKGN